MKAMTRMFGGNSKPNLKDSALRGGGINMAETSDDHNYTTMMRWTRTTMMMMRTMWTSTICQ